MVIAVNTCSFSHRLSDEGVYFLAKVLPLWAERFPQHRFYIIYNNEEVVQGLPAGVTPVFLDSKGLLPLRYRLSRLLKKIGAGSLLSLTGYCLSRTKMRQCLVAEPSLGPAGNDKKEGWRRHRRRAACLRRAARVVVFSEYRKARLSAAFGVPAGKIRVVPRVPREDYRPLDYDRAAAVKEAHTGGREYFLYRGSLDPQAQLVPLLKAFSLFKKRQKTGMKLLLVEQPGLQTGAAAELLHTYKYREDVVLLEGAAARAKEAHLVGAAYAFISLAEEDEGALEAVHCGLPVLLPAGALAQEWLQEAGLYFDAASTADLADKMMQVYRDETLRDRMIAAGSEKLRPFTWQQTADLLWEAVAGAENG
ncbi:glycosyltransferase [Paraflavisolibacter sp. H34]|uniref:glycosyltransferase n=1 Tax=Huijunlia imazamoxiresistens TaxID=3127457 RepID=UPI0030192451